MQKASRVWAGLLGCAVLGFAEQNTPPPQQLALPAPVSLLVTAKGLITLDVVVKDESGKPVTGLESKDFTLLDNGQPQKILSFQAFDGTTAKPDPPVEVILVIDALNLSAEQVFDTRHVAEEFLRKKRGHLAAPVSIFLLSSTGLSSTRAPSVDGNALAEEIAHESELPVIRLPIIPQAPAFRLDEAEPTFRDVANRNSLESLGSIVLEERRKPGKKLLYWLGNGWPFANTTGCDCFDWITELSTRIREAQITLWGASPSPDRAEVNKLWSVDYPAYMPVKVPRDARADNLALPVLATQSGGGILNGDDLDDQIGKCVEDSNAFYTFTFNPPSTNEVDEYHDLKVEVGKPNSAVHTIAGYYDEPSFRDNAAGAKKITVEQLEQMLSTANGSGDKDLAEQLFGVELTQRMSSARLASWETRLPGKKSRAALVGLADWSVFLALPASDIPTTAPPDRPTRQQMLSRTINYLGKTIPKLPNFFATRTTIQYAEPYKDERRWKVVESDQSLHETETSQTTVLYRDHKEVLDTSAGKQKKLSARERNLDTQGTFGPILAMVFAAASKAGSEFAWSNWEQGAKGLQAVFRYTIPQPTSVFDVGFCCLADPDRTIVFKTRAGYHGEIAINPADGAILRLTVVSDLEPKLLMTSSATMVEYGPVVIGGKAYVCPTRSVSISRQRTVTILNEWGESLGVYGRFETLLSDTAFGQYHNFRSQSRILLGDAPASNPR
jgi:VWFA-related protein